MYRMLMARLSLASCFIHTNTVSRQHECNREWIRGCSLSLCERAGVRVFPTMWVAHVADPASHLA